MVHKAFCLLFFSSQIGPKPSQSVGRNKENSWNGLRHLQSIRFVFFITFCQSVYLSVFARCVFWWLMIWHSIAFKNLSFIFYCLMNSWYAKMPTIICPTILSNNLFVSFRYPFYMLSSIQQEWKILTWLRYTVWIPLYPMGFFFEGKFSSQVNKGSCQK